MAYPVDFQGEASRNLSVMDFVPSAGAFKATEMAWRETIGRVYYEFNLETAVGRARVGRCGRVWVGATTQQATACKAEQRPQAWPRRLNRVRSAGTQKANAVVTQKVSDHAALPADTSGQLRFLGLKAFEEIWTLLST